MEIVRFKPANNDQFKVNNGNIGTRCKIYLKSKLMATEQNNFETVTVHSEKKAKEMKLLIRPPPYCPPSFGPPTVFLKSSLTTFQLILKFKFCHPSFESFEDTMWVLNV